MPDTTIQIIGKELSPVRDAQGLLLSPDMSITEAGLFDFLLVSENVAHLDVAGPYRPRQHAISCATAG